MPEGTVALARDGDGTLAVRVSGDWSLAGTTPLPAAAIQEVRTEPPERVVFQSPGLGRWDSSLVSFLAHVAAAARAESLAVDATGLPRGLQHLLALAAGP
ncbi:MAG TPA: STAS domain-containing protein, partial [Anaeromyxobacteraceae bacterium]|nr:STAS domain-containing protein [Anaeromyxobacteraceae bacterium]